MKYIAPNYMNNAVETSDVITLSRDVVAITNHDNGVVEKTVNLYEGTGEDKTYAGQMASFEFSIGNFFAKDN